MRTTLRLDDDVLARAKKLAIDTNRTLTQVVEDALQMALTQKSSASQTKPLKLHTCGGKGLQPGVELNDNAALTELMDQHDGSVGR
jgi:hypothetical protein